jgi:hypothetical protein
MGMRCGVIPGGLGEGEVGLLPPVRIPGSPWIEIYDAAITACQPHEMMERERRPMLTRTNLLYLPAVPRSCNKRTPRDLPPISAVAHSVEAKTGVGVPQDRSPPDSRKSGRCSPLRCRKSTFAGTPRSPAPHCIRNRGV